MAPRKRNSGDTTSPAAAASPRKTRSMTAGKRADPPPAKPPAKRAPKKQKAAKEKPADDASPEPAVDVSTQGVIIEACKQCKSFKTRANTVKEALESAVTGIAVTINPEKPRRGCFEVRRASGEVFISLLDMKQPFKAMKNLNMEEVVEDIVKKIK